MRIQLPDPGMLPVAEIEQQQIDARAARFFKGTGGQFIAVPGLQELKEVRLPGLLMEETVERSVWVDGRPENQHTLAAPCCFVIKEVDGVPLLGRSRWSNDGAWQPGENVMVVGVWDEGVSPVPTEPLPSMDAAQIPILTGPGGLEAGGEVSRRPGRPRKE